MTWVVTSGNGATTGIQAHITVPVLRTILLDQLRVALVFFAAATGTTILAAGAAALRAATTARRSVATATGGFALFWI